MIYKPYFLLTDFLFYMLLAFVFGSLFFLRNPRTLSHLKQIFYQPQGLASFFILVCFMSVALLDSIHFKVEKETSYFSKGSIVSLFDRIVSPMGINSEKTYSAPIARQSFSPQGTVKAGEGYNWYYPKLNIIKETIAQNPKLYYEDVIKKILLTCVETAGAFLLLIFIWQSLSRFGKLKFSNQFPKKTAAFLIFAALFCVLLVINFSLSYHLLGTDKVGNDILYASLKSIRTAIIIGSVTTLVMIPFAVVLGLTAGFYGGIFDDVIQYCYTTLSSIPGVLLIIAAMMSLQIYLDNHPAYFSSLEFKADMRLVLLCVILGIMSWTNLCRVLRAETLKIRELDFVSAAKILGTRSFVILFKHILPNVTHLIVISVVLDFSLLVLAEAVLTYIGVGVDPTTFSWGNMIDASRMELAREPLIWWPLLSAFLFMFTFVLAVNIFADVLRNVLDPRYAARHVEQV